MYLKYILQYLNLHKPAPLSTNNFRQHLIESAMRKRPETPLYARTFAF